MFCNQCGQVNSNDAKFCSNCGNKFENVNTQSSPPIQIQKETPSLRKKQIELWNSNAAANWSLLFTPIFGSYLQMKNWQALGELKEANTAKNWLIFTLGFILFINFLPYIANADPEQSSTLSRGLGFWYIIIWYFAYARKQPKYVKQKLNDNYQKKSWLIPLVSATIILFIVTFIIMLMPENTNNSYQEPTTQTIQPNYFDQFDEKNTNNELATPIQQESTTDQELRVSNDENNRFSKYVTQPTTQQEQPTVNSESQKPWEMDWGKTQQKQQNSTQTQAELEQAHFNAIFSAHPDAGSIVESQEFQYWVNSQTKGWRDYYNNTLNSGTSDQVIRMLNDYKKGINH